MAQVIHPVVVLKPVRAIAGYIVQMRSVIAGIKANPAIFANPNPSLDKVSADVDALEQKQEQTLLKVPGAIEDRKLAKRVVEADAKLLVAYVQTLVTANPAQAEKIAGAAKMAIQKVVAAKSPDLFVEPGTEPGSVRLVAHHTGKKSKSTLHDWRYTVDGGKTMINAPSTTIAQATITGLPSLTKVGFQHRLRDSGKEGDWSGIVYVVVP